MKSIFNLSKGILSVALISVAFASCSEDTMDNINKDKDHTTSVPAKFILADVITATAFSNIGGDFNTYYSTYVEHMVGVDNQLANAEKRNGEPSASSTFNNVWGNLYSTLKNARIAINISSNEVTGNYTTKGIGEVLAAINAGLIADSFGDTFQPGCPSRISKRTTSVSDSGIRQTGSNLYCYYGISGCCNYRSSQRR